MPWGRVVVAIVVAAVGVVALQSYVAGADQRRKAAAEPVAPLPSPSPLADLGIPLRPLPGVVHVASRLDAIAPDVAPVLQVLADGSLVLRRAAPPPARPELGGQGAGGGGAIVLPFASLRRLDGAQRGAMLAVVGAWIDERPVPSQRLVFADVQADAGELAELLSWAP